MSKNVYRPHNHAHCVDTALSTARQICDSKGARLTRVRLRVLELIWQNHKPMGAYDLLAILASEGFNPAPPTVYRALDFLLELGLIHRLHSLNAFIGCNHPDHQHPACFFVCEQCGQAQELAADKLQALTDQVEDLLGVKVHQQLTELSGICPACQGNGETSHDH